MVYHILPEREPFSDIEGGAIGRWVANVIEPLEGVVVCPSSDDTYGFSSERIAILKQWINLDRVMHSLRWLPWPARRYLWRWILQLPLTALQAGDVVWVHNRPRYAAALAGSLKNRGVQVVLHMHNSHLMVHKKVEVADLIDIPIVFCSEFIKQEATTLWPGTDNRHFVLHNGADEARFFPDDSRHNDPLCVVFIGRLIPEKGAHVLVDAMRILEKRKVAATCKLIGGGRYINEPLEKYASELLHRLPENVSFLGYRPGEEMAAILRHADIFCCPSSWQEPFGMVNVEAMACGIPVVAARVGGIPEIFEQGGGILVPPEDAEQLADSLEKLIVDQTLRRSMGAEALRAFQSRFKWEVIRRDYSALLAGVTR